MERRRNSHPRPARHVPADVLVWRSDVLRQAGCEPPLAWDLAADGDIDLHDLLNLIDRGCPPHLAARILAPLDRPEPVATPARASGAGREA
jgi:hypothetical protein